MYISTERRGCDQLGGQLAEQQRSGEVTIR